MDQPGHAAAPVDLDPTAALVRALDAATLAGRWDVVAQLAGLLADRKPMPPNVVDLAEARRRGRR